jgi:hypothetical protein
MSNVIPLPFIHTLTTPKFVVQSSKFAGSPAVYIVANEVIIHLGEIVNEAPILGMSPSMARQWGTTLIRAAAHCEGVDTEDM